MYLKLKELRNKNEYTTQNMGDLLEISKAFYCQIENDKRRLSYEMAIKIAQIFNLKPDELFYENQKDKIGS